jgi:transcriptional regulator with XRE-family HTH domain
VVISDRVFELLKVKGMSQKEFSERTGIPQSTISDWKRKNVNPASDKIMIICEVLEISPSALLAGIGDEAYSTPEHIMIDKYGDEFRLITGYRELNEKKKQRLLGYMEALQENVKNKTIEKKVENKKN